MTNKDRLMFDIKKVFEKHIGKDCALAIAFTQPKDEYSRVHWVTNVERKDGIKLFSETAKAMKAEMN